MNATTSSDSELSEIRASRPEGGVFGCDTARALDRIVTPQQAAEEHARTWVRQRWAMLYSSLEDGPGRF